MWTEGELLEHGQLTSSYTTKTNKKPPPNKGRLPRGPIHVVKEKMPTRGLFPNKVLSVN